MDFGGWTKGGSWTGNQVELLQLGSVNLEQRDVEAGIWPGGANG